MLKEISGDRRCSKEEYHSVGVCWGHALEKDHSILLECPEDKFGKDYRVLLLQSLLLEGWLDNSKNPEFTYEASSIGPESVSLCTVEGKDI